MNECEMEGTVGFEFPSASGRRARSLIEFTWHGVA